MDNPSDKNKTTTAIVTGGSRGIGRAIALEMARAGHFVVITYRSGADAAEETLRLIRQEGGEGEAVAFDVADSEEAKTAVESLLERHDAVDVLVNNAGVAIDQLFVMMPERDWDAVVNTTLKGFYNVTKPVLKAMIPRKRGAVVSIASVAALVGNRGQANYSAAKAGLIGASRSVASEVARLGMSNDEKVHYLFRQRSSFSIFNSARIGSISARNRLASCG